MSSGGGIGRLSECKSTIANADGYSHTDATTIANR